MPSPAAPSSRTNIGLLEGVGKVSKNVRIDRLENADREALKYYIAQALQHDERPKRKG